ncbi:MAG: phytanoyl-CoA dioxygenase family protein [Armatimonadetes bacterium]|nr:phytanoyl-CoA dioxygenase family protein [Armatimonadota bacterium]
MINSSLLPTDKDMAFYRENGWWASGKVISDDLIERMHTAMDRVFDGEYETGREPLRSWNKADGDPRVVRKIDYAYQANNTIRELLMNETVAAIGARLAETPAVRLWHDQLLYKPGHSTGKGNVGWHQDYMYWQCTTPADMLTAWIALVDVDETNGCLQMIPGSHKWSLIEDLSFFDPDIDRQMEKIRRYGEQHGQPDAAPVTVPLKAGEVSFHHCLTLHGSGPNMTSSPRRSYVAHMMPDHIRRRVGTPGDAHHNCLLFNGADGDLWRGDDFPVLFPQHAEQTAA